VTERSEGTPPTRSEGARDAVTERSEGARDVPSSDPTPEERRALFRVVRGTPTDAELAALTVVLAAVASPPPAEPPPPRSVWSDPAARLRRPLPVGPDAWRTSAWPR
jgi:Acyl-CoA carboxylase epsilon subunit